VQRQSQRMTYEEDTLAWISALRGGPTPARDDALERLHGVLLRATRFEVSRRRDQLSHVPARELDHLASQAADDALQVVLSKLDDFRGSSHFTTWASKFALREAGVRARRRAWQDREITLDDQPWPALPLSEGDRVLRALRDAVRSSLTPREREAFSALAINGVPIDVLAERRGSTRGALYETLRDARHKLRTALEESGPPIEAKGSEHLLRART
jgi:RNA polymerase sigma-70 factor, ECF subfamily